MKFTGRIEVKGNSSIDLIESTFIEVRSITVAFQFPDGIFGNVDDITTYPEDP